MNDVSQYRYTKLRVMAYQPRDFDPRDPASLRAAVEHLQTIPDAKYVGLQADSETLNVGAFKLIAPAFLKLKDILGKTPAQIWAEFDNQVERQVAYFERRDGNFNPL